MDEKPTLFLDINSMSPDGTVFLVDKSFSKDGSLLAYSLSYSGSDWAEIRIRDTETGEDYPEILKNVKFPRISWANDNKSFFYSVSWRKSTLDGSSSSDCR